MIISRVFTGRLADIKWLEKEILWCEDQLARGDLICDASVGEWATRAEGIVAAEEIERAMLAVESTRNRIRKRLESATRERDALMGWVSDIQKEDVRASVFLHYVKGYPYSVIADQYFGGTITDEAVRKMCGRCIRGEHSGKQGRPRKKEGERIDAGTAEKSAGD